MDIKTLFTVISVIIYIFAYLPYFRGIFKRETQPHEFTWLIWSITQGTATAGIWFGGGGVGSIPSTIATTLVILVFLLSLRDGKKDIARSDIVVLICALSAIGVWWFLDNPLLAVFIVTAVDLLGYIPTFRKSYNHPWTEKISSWGLFTIANIFIVLALESYNFLTLTFITAISVANLILFAFLLIRRKSIPKNSN